MASGDTAYPLVVPPSTYGGSHGIWAGLYPPLDLGKSGDVPEILRLHEPRLQRILGEFPPSLPVFFNQALQASMIPATPLDEPVQTFIDRRRPEPILPPQAKWKQDPGARLDSLALAFPMVHAQLPSDLHAELALQDLQAQSPPTHPNSVGPRCQTFRVHSDDTRKYLVSVAGPLMNELVLFALPSNHRNTLTKVAQIDLNHTIHLVRCNSVWRTQAHFTIVCASESAVHLVRLNSEPASQPQNFNLELYHTSWENERIISLCPPHPYNPNEVVAVLANRSIRIFQSGGQGSLSSSTLMWHEYGNDDEEISVFAWAQCMYGMHPRTLLVMFREQFLSIDLLALLIQPSVQGMAVKLPPHVIQPTWTLGHGDRRPAPPASAQEGLYGMARVEGFLQRLVISSARHITLIDLRHPSLALLHWTLDPAEKPWEHLHLQPVTLDEETCPKSLRSRDLCFIVGAATVARAVNIIGVGNWTAHRNGRNLPPISMGPPKTVECLRLGWPEINFPRHSHSNITGIAGISVPAGEGGFLFLVSQYGDITLQPWTIASSSSRSHLRKPVLPQVFPVLQRWNLNNALKHFVIADFTAAFAALLQPSAGLRGLSHQPHQTQRVCALLHEGDPVCRGTPLSVKRITELLLSFRLRLRSRLDQQPMTLRQLVVWLIRSSDLQLQPLQTGAPTVAQTVGRAVQKFLHTFAPDPLASSSSSTTLTLYFHRTPPRPSDAVGFSAALCDCCAAGPKSSIDHRKPTQQFKIPCTSDVCPHLHSSIISVHPTVIHHSVLLDHYSNFLQRSREIYAPATGIEDSDPEVEESAHNALEASMEEATASGPLDLTQDLESLLSLTQLPEDDEELFPGAEGRMSQYTEQAQQWEMGGMVDESESVLSAELLLQENDDFWS